MSQAKREIVDGELTCICQASPDINFAPLAFRMNHSSAICLPMLTEGTKFGWVHSQQVSLKVDREAELDRAFDRFPYLTHEEKVTLAQRCSLHPDEVNVWFMAQRLRYGISWECEDIHIVREKLISSESDAQGEGGLQRGKKRGVKENNLTMKRERVGQEGKRTMMGESVKASEQLEGEESQTLVKEHKDKRKTKQKNVKQEIIESKEKMEPIPYEGKKKRKRKRNNKMKSFQEIPTNMSFSVLDMPLHDNSSVFLQLEKQTDTSSLFNKLTELQKNLNLSPCSQNNPPTSVNDQMERATETDPEPENANINTVVTDVSKPKKFQDFNGAIGAADAPPVVTESCGAKARVSSTCSNTKTETQQAMLRRAFLSCQYPNTEHYTRLAAVIGIPRFALVTWFNDMRYHVKKGKPRWMTKMEHRKVEANIRFQQYMNLLARIGPSGEVKLEYMENSGEGTSATVPLE